MSEDIDKIERISRNKRVQQKRDLATRELVIRTLMSQPNGRRFLWLEISDGNVFRQTFIPGQPDATAFAEGQRSRSLALLNDVTKWCPADYVRMTQENSVVEISMEQGDQDERSDDD